ncbi:MAG: LptA/OstA family protein [Nautiliaceae bacterium]
MKKFLILLIVIFVSAAELEISSDSFKFDSQKLVSIFKGHVKAVKEKDEILSKEMIVYFDKNKKPVKFEAIGDVKFKFILDKNSTYRGKCDKLVYWIKRGDILLAGNAFVQKLDTNESIRGDKILLNKFTKNIKVEGGKKPINIIIKVEE